MVESLVSMGRCFSWGLGLLFLVLALYTLIRSSFISYTPFMALVSPLLPVCAFMLVAAAIGAYFGSWIDSLLGVDEVFATAGVVGGSIVGAALWRRRGVEREA